MQRHDKTSVGVLHFIYFVVNYISHPFTSECYVNDQCTADYCMYSSCITVPSAMELVTCYCWSVHSRVGGTDEVVLSQSQSFLRYPCYYAQRKL